MSLDAATEIWGRQEGICEAGVFALEKRGWRLLARKRFTNMGSAQNWASNEVSRQWEENQKRWNRMRASIVTPDNHGPAGIGETLDDILIQHEELRKAGDPKFNLQMKTNG